LLPLKKIFYYVLFKKNRDITSLRQDQNKRDRFELILPI